MKNKNYRIVGDLKNSDIVLWADKTDQWIFDVILVCISDVLTP
jgi:hypothetical protein